MLSLHPYSDAPAVEEPKKSTSKKKARHKFYYMYMSIPLERTPLETPNSSVPSKKTKTFKRKKLIQDY